MPRRTNPFQKLTASIVAVTTFEPGVRVEESVLEENAAGNVRELDVRVTGGQSDLRVLVECRDHSRPQTIEWIDSLATKGRTLGFEHIVAVSSSGFTSGATTEAAYHGIDTIHLREAEERDWRVWMFGLPEFTFTRSDYPLVESLRLNLEAGAADRYPEIRTAKVDELRLRHEPSGYEVPLRRHLERALGTPEARDAAARAANRRSDRSQEEGALAVGVCSLGTDTVLLFDNRSKEVGVFAVAASYRIVDISETLPTRHFYYGQERVMVARSRLFAGLKYVVHEKPNELILCVEQMAT